MITRRGVLAALIGAAAAEIILPPARTIFLPPRGGWRWDDAEAREWLRNEFEEALSIASRIPRHYLNGLAIVNPHGNGTQTIEAGLHRYTTLKGSLT